MMKPSQSNKLTSQRSNTREPSPQERTPQSNKDQPWISVVLPVYNSEDCVKNAVEAVLNQTYQNFEIVIIDDGSKDKSWEVLSEYKDHPQIRLFQQENMGLSATLNRGMELAKYDYIARQDHDDISWPTRFEEQMVYLKKHPELDFVGTLAQIDYNGKIKRRLFLRPEYHNQIKTFALFDSPFIHSSVLFKKDKILKLGGYSLDQDLHPAEDYELWTRMIMKSQSANLQKPLLTYMRRDESASNKVKETTSKKRLVKISRAYHKALVGEDLSYLTEIILKISPHKKTSVPQIIKDYSKLFWKINKGQKHIPYNIGYFHLRRLIKYYLKMKMKG